MSLQNVSSMIVSEFDISGFDTVENPKPVGIVMLAVYVLILLANTANICFIALDKRLHKPMYLFVCNLAAIDMLYSSSSSPTMIMVLITGVKKISYAACIFQMFIFHLGGVMEMFAIAVMAFDRWIAISSPLRYHSILTNTRTLLMISALWMTACAFVAVIPGTAISLPYCQSTLKYVFCDYAAVIRATCVNPNYYFNLVTTISFFLMFSTFAFICLSYLRIMWTVVKMNSKTDKKKMYNTCLSHLLVVACYYVPVFVRIVLTRLGLELSMAERNGLLIGAILGPSLVNPFIYCFRTKEIRNKMFVVFNKVEPRE